MQSPISWFEIPALDFERARHFYEQMLGTSLQIIAQEGFNLGVFPYQQPGVGGCLKAGAGYQPGAHGTLVYLFVGDDLRPTLDRAWNLGGQIVMPRTSIGEHGYIAHFRDSEGNTVGLHSLN